jgi:DNA modification methylase
MRKEVFGSITLYQGDCMEYMAGLYDKAFDLAVVDPPYGIGAGKARQGKWGASRLEKKDWDSAIPDDSYFDELRRVSVNQVVWGGNYFSRLWPTRGFIVWDKGAGFRGRDFAECEMAWTSFNRNAKVMAHDPLARGDYRGKIHPTQKPVKLYEWLLANYAEPGQRILDTHLGSGSSAIAAHYGGFDFVGIELDEDYFDAACRRIELATKQIALF